MKKISESVKKQLLEYPFVTAVTLPRATKIRQQTTKNPEITKNQGVKA